MRNPTRRTFLSHGVAPFIAATLVPSRLRGASYKIKVALVGCGGRGLGALSQVLKADPEAELSAMADVSLAQIEKAYDLIQKHQSGDQINCPDSRKFVGLDAYKQAIAECDVAILATPSGFRPLHFAECVMVGKHAFLEKCFGVDMPGVRSMMESNQMAKEKRLVCVAGLNRRFTPSYQNAIKNIHDGIVGDIINMESIWHTGLLRKLERGPDSNELQYQLANWRNFVWLSGDICSDLLLAGVDVCLWAKGMLPEKVTGKCGREQTGPDLINGDACDFFSLEYVFPDRSTLRASTRAWKDSAGKVSEEIVGTKGRATLETTSSSISDLSGTLVWKDRSTVAKDRTKLPDPYLAEQDKLMKSIRSGDYFNNLDDALNSQVAVLMGRMAAYSGREITWDEAINSPERFFPESLSLDSAPPTVPTKYGDYTVPPRPLNK